MFWVPRRYMYDFGFALVFMKNIYAISVCFALGFMKNTYIRFVHLFLNR